MLTLGDLFEALTGNRPSGSERMAVSRVAIDSRLVVPGSVFFALEGEALDGHQFIGEALSRGAIAIVGNARARELGFGRSLTLIDVAGLQPNPTLTAVGEPLTAVSEQLTAESIPVFVTENSLK